jgi:nitrite reductase/ring-hydroxylating ferredoxin subunit
MMAGCAAMVELLRTPNDPPEMLAHPAQPARRLALASGAPEALGLPSGWFVVALSEELPREGKLTTTFMSEELVLYRTASGEARAVAPHCPHLGAHLGRCGTVQGETLRCDFHGFCFDGGGACVATGYGTPPPAARLAVRSVREQNGLILVHHDASGRAASWAPPVLDMRGWTTPLHHRFRLRGHPQETTENGADVGHFSTLHGYGDVRELGPLRTEGPYLHARYAMKRSLGPLTRLGGSLSFEFDVHVHGLGYSFVDVDVKSHGFLLRHFIFSTPTEPGRIDLRLAVSARVPGGGGVAGLVSRRALAEALTRIVLPMYVHDVGQDVRIWEHKRHLSRPALADGDGPVGAYRRWARQFYARGGAEDLAG